MNKRSAILAVLVGLLLIKFLVPLFLFGVPLGYDVGMYRYLFLQYAESLKNLSLPELLPWAKEYPPGLFVLTAPFIMLGLPVDILLGILWNLFPVLIACILAWITAKRSTVDVGIATLVIALLSIPYYDGFVGMYYKAFLALLLTVLTYHLVEKKSSWFLLTAFLAVITHQQTGLILLLALAAWWVLQVRTSFCDLWYRRMTVAGGLTALVVLLLYLPQWDRAIWTPLKSVVLLRGEDAPGGAFPDTTFYLKTTGIIGFLGLVGLIKSFRRERGSLWQNSVLVCAVFIVFQLVFYKRFYLQLDFFLMPFAASALAWLWQSYSSVLSRTVIVVLLISQVYVSVQVMGLRTPEIRRGDLDQIMQTVPSLPENAVLVALENHSGPWLRGWKTEGIVGAPGLFDYPGWTYEQWGMFIDGSNAERRTLLSGLTGDVYFYLSSHFTGFYGDRAMNVVNDPCLEKVDNQPLLRSACSS